ncbi:hypothetical protein HGRIS_008529 [Hohenbuehelia grisea]|uniref:Kelch repeat-containing protein n=1 Tax=Hohenbuehelia grisea TaxID=104357 RepID=A0ABR3J897_9AGAR
MMPEGFASLITSRTTVKVSSGKSGAKFLIDGSPETCWTSQQDLPQHIQLRFAEPVVPKRLSLTFQGGFAGVGCSLYIDPVLAQEETMPGKPTWTSWCEVHPEDVNKRQSFELPAITSADNGISALKIVFEQSSDFYGRITVYDLALEGVIVGMKVKRESPSVTDERMLAVPSGNARFEKTALAGDTPVIRDWDTIVTDHRHAKLYAYGGVSSADQEQSQATSDLALCDLRSKTWCDLGSSLQYIPKASWSFFGLPKETSKPLPARLGVAAAIMHIESRTFLFLFGGTSSGDSETPPSSELLAIDVDEKKWVVVRPTHGTVKGRMNACMVALNNKLFIFGGRQDLDTPMHSFSVAEYDAEKDTWDWVVSDRPYPEHVPKPPKLGIQATVTSNGQSIFLVPSTFVDEDSVTLACPIIFDPLSYSFDIQDNTPFMDPETSLASYRFDMAIDPKHHQPSIVIAGLVLSEERLLPSIWTCPSPSSRRINYLGDAVRAEYDCLLSHPPLAIIDDCLYVIETDSPEDSNNLRPRRYNTCVMMPLSSLAPESPAPEDGLGDAGDAEDQASEASIEEPAELVHGTFGDTHYRTFAFGGQHPTHNDWISFQVDPENGRVFTYGGTPPSDRSYTPSPSFYVCDINTMEWNNLTDSLRRVPSVFVEAPQTTSLEVERLPARLRFADALFRHQGRTFFVIFGGWPNEPDTPAASDFIVIDVDHLTWSIMEPIGSRAVGRLSPKIVCIDNCLYIFGGSTLNERNLNTYSIAEYNPQSREWKWVVADKRFPNAIPTLGKGAFEALPIFNNTKILLMRGRLEWNKRITLSAKTTVIFTISDRSFKVQSRSRGAFPKDIEFYELFNWPLTKTSESESESESVVGICVWVPREVDGLVPQVFKYYPESSTTSISNLNLADGIWALDLDLQDFFRFGDRLFLIGYDDQAGPGLRDPVCNVGVEIILGRDDMLR